MTVITPIAWLKGEPSSDVGASWGTANDEVILNILSRRREPQPVQAINVVVDLRLKHPPIADCARYDTVRGLNAAA
jgi:hypothetical protein